MSSDKPPSRSKWFWWNLAALAALIPIAWLLFDRHFKLYVNQAILVGGTITIWAIVQGVWGSVVSMSGFDAEDYSRQWLNSQAATRLLIVGLLLLGYLWFSASSLYFEFAGDAARSYKIEVKRVDSGESYLAPFTIGASERILLKDIHLVGSQNVALRCQIVDPIGFAPADCSIAPGKSTHVEVPVGFKMKEYHLVRLIPLGPLYQKVLPADQAGRSNYYVELAVNYKNGAPPQSMRLDDLRKQSVSVLPSESDEGNLVKLLDKHEGHVADIVERYMADGVEEAAARQFATVLAAKSRDWPIAFLHEGDVLTIDVLRVPRQDEDPAIGPARRTIKHKVGKEQVQNIWLSPP